jgi:hypothetical protein
VGSTQIDAQTAEEVWIRPDELVTDDLRSYAAAAYDLGMANQHRRGRWRNNRAEKFTSANPAARVKDAKIQERGVSATISLSPRSSVQQLQRPASNLIWHRVPHTDRRHRSMDLPHGYKPHRRRLTPSESRLALRASMRKRPHRGHPWMCLKPVSSLRRPTWLWPVC